MRTKSWKKKKEMKWNIEGQNWKKNNKENY